MTMSSDCSSRPTLQGTSPPFVSGRHLASPRALTQCIFGGWRRRRPSQLRVRTVWDLLRSRSRRTRPIPLRTTTRPSTTTNTTSSIRGSTSGHLHALASGGVFNNSQGSLPTDTFLNSGYGIDVKFVTSPNAPTAVSATAVSPTSLSVAYAGDGDAGQDYNATCTSDTIGGPYVGSSSSVTGPISISGITFSPNQQITCGSRRRAAPESKVLRVGRHDLLYPSAPTAVSVSQVGLTSVNVAFTGDGATGATFTATCTSSAGGPPLMAAGATSPLTVNGFTNLAMQTITCSVTETAHSLTERGVDQRGDRDVRRFRTRMPGDADGTHEAVRRSRSVPRRRGGWAPATATPAFCLVGYLLTPSSGDGRTGPRTRHGLTGRVYLGQEL